MNSTICFNQIRRISQAAFERLKIISSENLIWKSNEDDPRKHSHAHEGLLYTLPDDKSLNNKIFGEATPFDIETSRYYKAMGTTAIMIRKPALTALEYLEKIENNDSVPNIRILFYGDKGTGKTHTLSHLLHYLHLKQNHIIFHIRQMKRFSFKFQEHSESTSRPGRIDTPLDSTIFLQQFKIQNEALLNKVDSLTCSQDYKWSLREVTKAGEPLTKVIDHGINRGIHASDCVAVLAKELILASDAGKIKLACVLDNVQFLFQYYTWKKKHADTKKIVVDEVTVARAIKKLINGNYRNGVVLASCDDKLSKKQNQTPREVLGMEGWNCFDPCLPINVPVYSRKEFESCMNFYQDVGWLCRPESKTVEARDEIRFVSAMNPLEVATLCRPL